MTISQAEAEQLIGKLSYKPGWQFSFEPIGDGQGSVPVTGLLVIRATVTDAHDAGRVIEFTVKRVIPLLTLREHFLQWFTRVIIEAEIHESREYLRYDGELIDNPHQVTEVVT